LGVRIIAHERAERGEQSEEYGEDLLRELFEPVDISSIRY
jgi:hypothetical protein